MCATFSTSSHQIHEAGNGWVVSMSVWELPKSADTVLQSSPACGRWTHTHKAELFDHRLKGVIVSNFIPTAVFTLNRFCMHNAFWDTQKLVSNLFFVLSFFFSLVKKSCCVCQRLQVYSTRRRINSVTNKWVHASVELHIMSKICG